MFYYLLFVVLLLINFKTFTSTPLWDIDRFVGAPVALFGIQQFVVAPRRASVIRRWVLCFFIMGLVSNYTSMTFYKQSFVDGIVASLNFYMVFGLIPLTIIINHIKLKEKSFERVIVVLMWLNLLIKVFILAFHIKYSFTSYFTGSEKGLDGRSFPGNLISLGIFYYFIKYIRTKNIRYGLFSVLFLLGPNIFEFQRMDFAVAGLIMMFLLFKDFKKNAGIIATSIVIIILIIVIALQFFYQYLAPYFSYFEEALKIFDDQSHVNDSSTAARVVQYQYFLSRAFENPIFGLGIPRPGAKAAVFAGGQPFNYADMGILGIYFTHGVIGVIVFIFQLNYVKKLYAQVKNSGLIVLCLYFYMAYLAIWSLGTGYIFHYAHLFITLIVFINYFKKREDAAKAAAAERQAEINAQLELAGAVTTTV